MNMIFTKEGFRALRIVYLATVSGIAASIFLVGSAYLYWQAEKRNNVQSVTAQQEARARLDAARRERDDLRDSEQTYKVITARGVFQPEQRLDLVEAFAALKTRHHLVALEYEVQPQRPLKLSGNTTLVAVDVFGSRIKFKARAFHDGDLVGFLDEFPRMQRGFFPLDRCALFRVRVALHWIEPVRPLTPSHYAYDPRALPRRFPYWNSLRQTIRESRRPLFARHQQR